MNRVFAFSKPLALLFVALTVVQACDLCCAQVEALDTEHVSLLKDVNFSEGFGAAFIYGSEYSGGRRPPLGDVLKYRDISPWQVHLIPDGPLKKVGIKTHPWDFQEGLHHNFKDKAGKLVRELHAHRLVVNHTIEENSPERLQFAQFNNYGLKKNDPSRDTRLVKRVTTDRHGTLRLYYNSQHEIRNVGSGNPLGDTSGQAGVDQITTPCVFPAPPPCGYLIRSHGIECERPSCHLIRNAVYSG